MLMILYNTGRSFFSHLHGAFLPVRRDVPEELKDIHAWVFSSKWEYSSVMDGFSMRSDLMNLKSDFRKAFEAYKKVKGNA
jgi:hypothetical protein